MNASRIIQERLAVVFAKMAEPVRWQDKRLAPQEQDLAGYLTKGAGPDGPWEFRFQAAVPGLQTGGILKLARSDERWRITQVAEERLETELLFVAAQVQSLDAAAGPPTDDEQALVDSLRALLAESSLGALEAGDAAEALARLPSLLRRPEDPGHAARIRARLQLLKACFKACAQTHHQAHGLLLKLEAQLKRRGYRP